MCNICSISIWFGPRFCCTWWQSHTCFFNLSLLSYYANIFAKILIFDGFFSFLCMLFFLCLDITVRQRALIWEEMDHFTNSYLYQEGVYYSYTIAAYKQCRWLSNEVIPGLILQWWRKLSSCSHCSTVMPLDFQHVVSLSK